MILIPLALAFIVNLYYPKVLFLVPIFEFLLILLYNTFIYTQRGSQLEILWLLIGTSTASLITLILLIIRKRNSVIISIIVVLISIFYIILWSVLRLSFMKLLIVDLFIYFEIVFLSLQKNKENIWNI